MKLPDLLPPNDLLKQFEGVESGLRKRRSLGTVGAIGTLVVAALQVVVAVVNSKWWQDLTKTPISPILKQWPYLLGFIAVAFFALLYTWSRFWLQESQQAFRYTCSIAGFEPVRFKTEDPPWLTPQLREQLSGLSYDLAERFSLRVSRIRFRDKPPESKPGEPAPNKSHIHIHGVYILRQDRDDRLVLEIMPSVRIGPAEASEALAHPVTYRLEKPSIDRNHYERIQERLYFSVATEVYRQIQEDVARKIELLPTGYFRAIAYFYEAEDYSRSNTLDAYKEASKLYQKAIELFDPHLKPLPETPLLKRIERMRRDLFRGRAHAMSWCSLLHPMLARTQLMCARAEIGYANMLLYRRILAGLAGERLNPVYEASPVALDAAKRLERLNPDVPGRCESLFDAYVTTALARDSLGDVQTPRSWLEKAQRLDPARSEETTRYLFVSGKLLPDLNSRMNRLRRAIELEPRFEVARWTLAITRELMWRGRPTLEPNVAQIVLDDYDEVLKINPGNVSAWANRGYIRWLVGGKDGLDKAAEEFANGLEYKTMRPQTFIADLDYGLARIAAERGDILSAYKHYVDAVSAMLAEGVFHGPQNSTYYFNRISSEILGRIDRYRQCVKAAVRALPDSDASPRVKDAVYAFALSDCGEACYTYFLRRGDYPRFNRARALFRLAARLNPQYAIPVYQLADANRQKALLEANEAVKGFLLRQAVQGISRAAELDAEWADGALKKVEIFTDWAKQVPRRRIAAADEIANVDKDAAGECAEGEEKLAEARKLEQTETQFSEAKTTFAARPQEAVVAAPAAPFPSAGASPVDIRAQAVPIESRVPEAQQPAAPPPIRIDPNPGIEEAARLLKEQAAKLTAQAEAAERRAAAMRQREEALQSFEDEQYAEFAKSVRKVKGLLPHAWLSCNAPLPASSPPAAELAPIWNTLENAEYLLDWKWEREFNDLHAKALRCRALAGLVLRGDASGDIRNKLVPFLRQHFYPGDFDLMDAGRQPAAPAKPGEPQPFTPEMQSVICSWASENPADYWALSWVLDPSFLPNANAAAGDSDGIMAILARALDQQNLSAHTCLWIGEQCQEKMPAIARKAFLRVPATTTHAETLARAALRLEQLAHWDDAREIYERVLSLWGRSPTCPAASAVEAPAQAATDAATASLPAPTTPAPSAPATDVATPSLPATATPAPPAPAATDAATPSLPAPSQTPSAPPVPAHAAAATTAARATAQNRRIADDCRIALGRILWSQGLYTDALARFDQVQRDTPWVKSVVQAILAEPDVDGSHRIIKSWLQRKSVAIQARPAPATITSAVPEAQPEPPPKATASFPGPRPLTPDPRERSEQARRDVNEAILLFAEKKPNDLLPVVTPVAVEAESSLFPEGEEWAKTHPLFTEYLPQMRSRIENRMGVRVPGIRFRAEQTELPPEAYRILLNEIPVASGQVMRGSKFCPDTAALSQKGSPGYNPQTPWRDGAWLAEPDWPAAVNAGVPLWDHFQYILAHVEALMRANLAEFLGIQEVENMLDNWHNNGGSSRIAGHVKPADSVLPDIACRLRFTRLLQALVSEGVPVRDFDAILDAIRETHTGPAAGLLPWLEAARLKLRDRLPGNRAGSEFFWLSPGFETAMLAGIERLDDAGDPLRTKTLFSLMPETAQDLLKAVRKDVGLSSGPQVIVTRAAGIRPFVSRLIQFEFPYIQTLSLAELRPNLRETVRKVIDL